MAAAALIAAQALGSLLPSAGTPGDAEHFLSTLAELERVVDKAVEDDQDRPTNLIATSSCTPQMERESLHDILTKFDSDKATHHGYTRYYEPLFESRRSAPIRLVEIGVERGRSMKAWQSYFPGADHVYGIGYGNFQTTPKSTCSGSEAAVHGPSPQCTLYKGDQGDPKFLKHFVGDTGGKFDIVIDDGSHVPSHQRTSFEHLWPSVKPGGVYAIEDVETSYWDKSAEIYGYSLEQEPSIVDHMKQVSDTINREFKHGASQLPEVYSDISSITFGQNIILLHKQTGSDQQYFGRAYRFANKLPPSPQNSVV